MAPHRGRHLLAIGSDVRLMLAGFGLVLAVGLVSGVGVGVLSSRQLARVPEVDVQQASLGDGVQEAFDRLRQIAQLDWRAAMEPRPAAGSNTAVAAAAVRAAMPAVSAEDAARREIGRAHV